MSRILKFERGYFAFNISFVGSKTALRGVGGLQPSCRIATGSGGVSIEMPRLLSDSGKVQGNDYDDVRRVFPEGIDKIRKWIFYSTVKDWVQHPCHVSDTDQLFVRLIPQECFSIMEVRLNFERDNPDLYVMRARLNQLDNQMTAAYHDVTEALRLDPSHKVRSSFG